MKTTLFAGIISIAPVIAAADPDHAISFSAGLGGSLEPEYFGSENYALDPTGEFEFGYLRVGDLEFGDPDPNAVAMGLQPRASFRLIGARTSADYPELAGLDDVDLSIELGGGIGYRSNSFFAYADLRHGVIGHQGWVAEFGADAILRPTPDLTITVGPRALWGSQGYADTYFGVSPTEAANSTFSAYSPGSGLVSAGIEIGATYEISPDWSLNGTVAWERLIGAAAASPIAQSEDSVSVSLAVMRRFSFGH